MTKWTPTLERNIAKLGDCMEKQLQDKINPQTSIAGTYLRLTFRIYASIQPVYNKICKEAGFETNGVLGYGGNADFSANMQKMIDLAAANNSTAADKLKSVRAFSGQWLRQDEEAYPHDPFKKIQLAKQRKLAFKG